MDDIKDRQESVRGQQAADVLNNPIYQEAFIAIRAGLMKEFQNTKFKQTAERDEVWRKMQTTDWVEKHLKQVMLSGQVSDQSIAMRSKQFIKGL